MADDRKIMASLLLLLNYIFLAKAHQESPDANLIEASDAESVAAVEMERGLDAGDRRMLKEREWQYEGMPIEMPNQMPENRRMNNIPEEVETTTTTTITAPTRAHPPMNLSYRRIYDPDERAQIEDYPFIAAVLVNKQLWCGAAIIDKDRVLTAAHCLQLQYNNRFFREYVKMLTVRVGSTNATNGGEVLRVTEISFHPNYKPSTLEFNVAVLKLHKNMTFGEDPPISDIPVARNVVVPVDNNIMFLGWGSVLGGGGTGGTVLLQKVELPVYDFADCQTAYGRVLVTHTNFCAGFITKRKNVCNHDAGGPAIMGGTLVGILSFSAKRCDSLDHPAVFLSVGAIAPWLDQISEAKPHSLKMA